MLPTYPSPPAYTAPWLAGVPLAARAYTMEGTFCHPPPGVATTPATTDVIFILDEEVNSRHGEPSLLCSGPHAADAP